MINNYQLITPLLNFDDEHDFYMLYVFKRKKDQPEAERVNHQSVRTLKSYCISGLQYLDDRMAEIIDFCEHFKARAYIQVNRQNHKDISLLMIQRLAQRLRNGVINQKALFDSIVGELHSTEKRWVLDVDTHNKTLINKIETDLAFCEPVSIFNKCLARIPTKQGVHLITTRFNTERFGILYPEVTVCKHNPTLLYLPKSLD